MDITRQSIPKSDWLHSLQPRLRSSIQSGKTRLEADSGSDHEVLIAKFRLKLKKKWKTIRPFRYDLNQTPYDYTVEVTNIFKELDLIECLKNYGRRFVTFYRRWWSIHLQEEECKKAKQLSEEALQIAVNRREMKGKGEKERYTHLNGRQWGVLIEKSLVTFTLRQEWAVSTD